MKTRHFTFGLLVIVLTALLSFDTIAQCCVAPANLTVQSLGRREADLRWRRIRQAGCTTPVRYRVQYREVGTASWTTLIVTTHRDDKFGDTTVRPLKPATTYQWRVQGICSSTNVTAFVAGPRFTTLTFALDEPASSVSSASVQGKITVTAYPNPVISQLTLTGSLKAGGPVDIQIVNSVGQTVLHRSYNFSSGDFSTGLDFSKLPPGVYMILVNNKTERATLNILKQ